MKLIIASNNNGKISEIKSVLRGCFDEMLSLAQAGINIDVEETGETFEQNARIKAEAVFSLRPGYAVLSDDSGLCVDALGGAPGVFSARYSGGSDSDNNAKLLANMQGENNRSAEFVCCICLLRPDLPEIITTGKCRGEIGYNEIGENGFGYDPLFICGGLGLTFAQLSDTQKNSVSHRAKALDILRARLNKK